MYDGTADRYDHDHRHQIIAEKTHDLSIHLEDRAYGATTVLTLAFLLSISSPVERLVLRIPEDYQMVKVGSAELQDADDQTCPLIDLQESPSMKFQPDGGNKPGNGQAASGSSDAAQQQSASTEMNDRVLRYLPAAKVSFSECVKRKNANLFDISFSKNDLLCPFQPEVTNVHCSEPGRGAVHAKVEEAKQGTGHVELRQQYALQLLVHLPDRKQFSLNDFRLTAVSTMPSTKHLGTEKDDVPEGNAEDVATGKAVPGMHMHEVTVTIHADGPALKQRTATRSEELDFAQREKERTECTYSQWVDWNCNTECGGGVRLRTRRMLLKGCAEPEPVTEFIPCNTFPCEANLQCQISPFAANEPPLCSSTCCGGQRSYRDGMYGGHCPDYMDFGVERHEPCVTQEEEQEGKAISQGVDAPEKSAAARTDSSASSPSSVSGSTRNEEQAQENSRNDPMLHNIDPPQGSTSTQWRGYQADCEYEVDEDGNEVWTPTGECSEFCGQGLEHFLRMTTNKRFSQDCPIPQKYESCIGVASTMLGETTCRPFMLLLRRPGEMQYLYELEMDAMNFLAQEQETIASNKKDKSAAGGQDTSTSSGGKTTSTETSDSRNPVALTGSVFEVTLIFQPKSSGTMLEVTAPPGYSFLPDAGTKAESQLIAAGEAGVPCPESLIRDSSLPMLKSYVENPCTVTLTSTTGEESASMMEQQEPSASLQVQVAKTTAGDEIEQTLEKSSQSSRPQQRASDGDKQSAAKGGLLPDGTADRDGAAPVGGVKSNKETGTKSKSDSTAKPSAKPPQKSQTIRLDLHDVVTPKRPPRSVCWLARGSESEWYEENKNSKLCLIRHPRTYYLTVAVAAPTSLCNGSFERVEVGFDLSELRCKEDPGFWSYTVKGRKTATMARTRAHSRVMKARSVVDSLDTDSFVTAGKVSCGVSRPCPVEKPYCRAEFDGVCTAESEFFGIPLQRMDRGAAEDPGEVVKAEV
ncbi:unnamed protein product [Amoebophrya sp. A120]|nr:unnamed protein product [Amoebophrya sp. A120]|eukprot:GSA120T00000742001.1